MPIFCNLSIVAMGFTSAFAAEKPEIFVQMGHTDVVYAEAFSPDVL